MTKLNMSQTATAEDIKWVEKNVPKKYWEAIDAIERGGLDGWWLHLKDGFHSTSTDTHQIHEDTVSEFKKQFKTIVREEVEETEEEKEFQEIMELDEEERQYRMMGDESLQDLNRRMNKKLKHIEERMASKMFPIDYRELPEWEKSKEKTKKVIEYTTKELERRK